MLRSVAFALILTAALALVSCQQEEITVEQVTAAIDSTEARLVWLDYRLALEEWQDATRGSSDSLEFYRKLRQHILADDQTADLLAQGARLIVGEEDQRRLEIIRPIMMRASVEADPAVAALRDSLRTVRAGMSLRMAGQEVTSWSARNVMTGDGNRLRRGEAFVALCGPGESLADGAQRLIRLRNLQARRLGYNSYIALIFAGRGQELSDYVSLLGRLEEATSEAYREALTRIERKLSLNMLEVWDLEYASADIRARIDRYFPVDSQLAFVKNSLDSAGYDLDKLPVYFDITAFKEIPAGAATFNVKPGGDHRIRANLIPDLGSTRRLMESCGSVIHSLSIAQSRDFFAVYSDPAWSRAMAGIIAAFCDEPDWLERQAHLPRALAEEYVESLKDQRLFALRMLLTDLMFEYEAYQNANRDLNQVYWELFERYLLLPRHDDLSPWASRAEFVDAPVTLQDDLTADMIAAQTIAYIRTQYGSLFNSEDTRAFLEQNYFRFGSRYDWRELLERGTSEPLDYRYLLAMMGG